MDQLNASSAQLGVYFVLSAVLSAAFGIFGGHLSDRLGRRRMILAGWSLVALVPLTWTSSTTSSARSRFFCSSPASCRSRCRRARRSSPTSRPRSATSTLRLAARRGNLGVTLGAARRRAAPTGNYDILWVGVSSSPLRRRAGLAPDPARGASRRRSRRRAARSA